MTNLEALRAARAWITDPRRWSNDGYGDGNRRCMIGALGRTASDIPTLNVAMEALKRVVRDIGFDLISEFNDTHTHAEVLAAYDRAIAIEEAREAEMTAGDPLLPVSVVNIEEPVCH